MQRHGPPPPPLTPELEQLASQTLRLRDDSDPWRRSVELAQRARMTLDVAAADLDAAETVHGPFHPTAWYFRNALNEARHAWDRLRAEMGTNRLDAALKELPIAHLTLRSEAGGPLPPQSPTIILIPISGQTYRVQRVSGTDLAPIQWRLTRLHPPLEDGPYFACRLADGSTQCDCADWSYQDDLTGRAAPCKHLRALAALGWI